ncbi:hypothetical protein M231_04339 [Tremella mesenterica]|uniref:Uncharacterized protein n=1 Tax=Tremella mesenterica TaxID=5217 RepID=A0A4Q1BL72_TREME|nr:hypothetical protein M231_04339 [Tremella mesenterica]
MRHKASSSSGPLDNWSLVSPKSNSPRATDPSFPTYEVMNGTATDLLLFPTKMLTPGKVKTNIGMALVEGNRVSSAAIAEELLITINASNSLNEHLLYEDRQDILKTLAKVPGEALLRLGEIIRWPSVVRTVSQPKDMHFLSRYMAIIGYLTSEAVIKSASLAHVNALYGLVENNLEHVITVIDENVKDCMDANNFDDPNSDQYMRHKVVHIVSGAQVFKPIAILFLEYFERCRAATTSHPEVASFIDRLTTHFEDWADRVMRGTFQDRLTSRLPQEKSFFINKIRGDLDLLAKVASRCLKPKDEHDFPMTQPFVPSLGVLAGLAREYEGPGALCSTGPRHDNDHISIADIQIPPTTAELLSEEEAYLPANLPGAHHHLPEDCIEKILDIQFRLLRADATTSLRTGVKLVLKELDLGPEAYADSKGTSTP